MKNKTRKTKIVATIGPASKSMLNMEKLIDAGVDIMRFNLKHNTFFGHAQAIGRARKVADKQGRKIEILIDLPSPDYFQALDFLAEQKPEHIALSHVKKSSEINSFRKFWKKKKIASNIVTKIETNEVLKCFSRVLSKSDSFMVARGDLGRSIPIEQVPFVQKEIILASKDSEKFVIVATEMLLSMVKNKIPTRAEASDVANAVLDNGDALMLSEETAIGANPIEAVKVMDKIIREAESWQKLGHLHIFSVKSKRFIFGKSR